MVCLGCLYCRPGLVAYNAGRGGLGLGSSVGQVSSHVTLRPNAAAHPPAQGEAHPPGDPGPDQHGSAVNLLWHLQDYSGPRARQPHCGLLLVRPRPRWDRRSWAQQLGHHARDDGQKHHISLRHLPALVPHAIHTCIYGGRSRECSRAGILGRGPLVCNDHFLVLRLYPDSLHGGAPEHQQRRDAAVLAFAQVPARLERL
mmetsp:Transcript_23542/g.67868  ORF Transcript_23542/g.67868 Transcript_23542/m.67868 type:complete len:200 (+) Transcript_23542:1156-1755(+)